MCHQGAQGLGVPGAGRGWSSQKFVVVGPLGCSTRPLGCSMRPPFLTALVNTHVCMQQHPTQQPAVGGQEEGGVAWVAGCM